MSITTTEYPNFIRPPFDVTSNWQEFGFPGQESLRTRILYKAVNEAGQPADPLLLQVVGAYGFVAPQGYEVTRVHFCSGMAIGAWIQGPGTTTQVYIQSRGLDLTIQDQMLSLTQPQKDGEFGFGITSRGVSSNKMRIDTPGLHTTLPGPFTALPKTLSLAVGGVQFKQPLFQTSQPDGSSLVGVFKVFSDTIYIYGYRFDILNLARVYGVDKHFVIQEQLRILDSSAPETTARVKQAFLDLLMDCFGSPLALTLRPEQQKVAIINASSYLNGQRTFGDLAIQGNDQIKPQMTGICTSPAFKDEPVCACYQSAIHPCLSPVCLQAGYKTSEVAAYDCKQELKGMVINQQNCILYNQQVAGGYISGDQNIKQSCTQQVGQGGVTIQSGNNAQTPTEAQKQSGQLSQQEIVTIVVAGLLVCIIGGLIAWIVARRKRQQEALGTQPFYNQSSTV